MSWGRWDGRDLLLELRVQPRAACDELVDLQSRPRLRLRAPAVDGRANDAALAWLAEAFGVPASRVALERGGRSRNKVFRIREPTRFPAGLADLRARPRA